MQKEQVLQFIQQQMANGVITENDLAILQGKPVVVTSSAQPASASPQAPVQAAVRTSEPTSLGISTALYAVGFVVIVVGIAIFLFQNWSIMGAAGRILSTFGLGFVCLIAAYILKEQGLRNASQVLYAVAFGLIPLGTSVVLAENNVEFSFMLMTMIAIGHAALAGALYFKHRLPILALITGAAAGWAYFSVIGDMTEDMIGDSSWDIIRAAIIIAGLAYGFVAWSYGKTLANRQEESVRTLYAVAAIIGVIGPMFTFEDMSFITILVAFAAAYYSVFIKSTGALIASALAVIGSIFYVTGEYFRDTLGWSLTLVVFGFLLIGVGIMTVRMRKEYIVQA
jgi:hypothetical protein